MFDEYIQYSNAMSQRNVSFNITLSGNVQGVGLRPRLKRLADDFAITGWVRNEGDRVGLQIQGDMSVITAFLDTIRNRIPDIVLQQQPAPLQSLRSFAIVDSVEQSAEGICQLPADRGICGACVTEFHDPGSRRHLYPLIACHDCGPRFSILHRLPFCRHNTGFARWQPCQRCQAEFADPADRRFHSELISCPDCGPTLQWWDGHTVQSGDALGLIQQAAACLTGGGILALKSQTGMQLLCRADDVDVVARLRAIKQRPRKPLALLVASIAQAQTLAILSGQEQALLQSAARPIVLVAKRSDPVAPVAANVAPDVPDWGLLLPVSGLHLALLQHVNTPLICTSANRSGEPVLYDNADLLAQAKSLCDQALLHDVDIRIPQDDSLVMHTVGRDMVLRRARGFTHQRFSLGVSAPRQALGGDLKHAVALGWNGGAALGPYVGDMDSMAVQVRQQRVAQRLRELHGFVPRALASDLHPGYFTVQQARSMDLPRTGVQHHLAHVLVNDALCALPTRYLALAWDGAGWGDDGAIWGSEVFLVEQGQPRRVAALLPFSLPGGEQAARQPWRMALALGFHAGLTWPQAREQAVSAAVGESHARILWQMLVSNLNNPRCQAMGRLFDGVSHVLTGCDRQSFEGEAALQLQALAQQAMASSLSFNLEMHEQGGFLYGDWRTAWRNLLQQKLRGMDSAGLALGFHQGLVNWALALARHFSVQAISISGGCFQNRLLQSLLLQQQSETGIEMHWPASVPVNDGGLAIGQLWCCERTTDSST